MVFNALDRIQSRAQLGLKVDNNSGPQLDFKVDNETIIVCGV